MGRGAEEQGSARTAAFTSTRRRSNGDAPTRSECSENQEGEKAMPGTYGADGVFTRSGAFARNLTIHWTN